MSNNLFAYYIFMGQNKQNQQSITKKTDTIVKKANSTLLIQTKTPSTSNNLSTPSNDNKDE
jgi:hypothetical protein